MSTSMARQIAATGGERERFWFRVYLVTLPVGKTKRKAETLAQQMRKTRGVGGHLKAKASGCDCFGKTWRCAYARERARERESERKRESAREREKMSESARARVHLTKVFEEGLGSLFGADERIHYPTTPIHKSPALMHHHAGHLLLGVAQV
jgi:hypothetical protein